MPRAKLMNLLFTLVLVFLIVNVLQYSQFNVLAQGNGQEWLDGWAYREALTIQNASGAGTNYQIPITVYKSTNDVPTVSSTQWYSMSQPSNPISGNPTDQHGFCVVHATNIVQCNVVVDGATRTYLAYDSDSEGNNIYLYYSNSISGTWTAYSGNPILTGTGEFRTPSVVFVNGTFQMFLNNINDKDIERWTSKNGITFTKAETVLTTNYDEWTNPFVWLNPNDNTWYLFWEGGNDTGGVWNVFARNSTSITGFASKTNELVIRSSGSMYNLAFPTIMYRNGVYWLLCECCFTANTPPWGIRAFASVKVTSGYVQCSNSPILTDDEACPEVFIADNNVSCYLFTNQNSSTWYQEIRTVNLSPSNTPSTLTTNGHCMNNFGDIRFTASDGVTLLNYWMQSMYNGANATFWVQDPDNLSNSNSTIYMYYGNSHATTTSNGKNTFELFDNFSADSSIDWTNTWQSSQQSLYSLSGGQLVCSQASTGSQLIQTKASFSGGFCAESLVKETNAGGQAYMDMEQNTEIYTGNDNEILDWYGYGGSNGPTIDIFLGGTGYIQSYASDTTDFFTLVEKCPSSGTATGQIWLNGALQFTATGTPSYTTAHVGLLDYVAGTAQVSWVFVRKYVNPEPSLISVGNEQASSPPSFGAITASNTVAGSSTLLSCPVSSVANVSCYIYSWNNTGAWINQTATFFTNFINSTAALATLTGTWNTKAGNTISAKVYANDTDNEWSASSQYNFTLTPASPTSPTVSISPSSWTMDAGQSKTFSATPSGGSGSYSGYQWYVNGVAQTSQTGSTYAFAPVSSGVYSITVTVTDNSGATSTQSSAATVTVAASPTVSVAPVGPLAMDVGQVQTFTATVTGGSGTINYQWYLDGTAVGSNSASYSYTAAGTSHSVTCKVTDSASIPVTSPASNAVTITVAAAPTVSVSPSSWTMDVGQSETFTATASGGTGTLSYKWYLGGSAVSGATGSTYQYSPSSAGSPTIYCDVTDSASTPDLVQSNTPSVTVNAAPTVSVSPSSWTMDVGQSETFTATASAGSGSLSFQWYVNSVLQSAATSSFTYTASATGTFTIYVQVTDSASAPVTVKSNSATVQVNSALVAPTASASPTAVTQGQTSRLTSTAITTGTSPYSYQWYSKAPGASSYSAISGATRSSYSFVTSTSTATGTWSFELEVTDHTGASVTSNVVTVTVSARTHGRL